MLKINCLGASNTQIIKSAENEKVYEVNYPVILGLLLRCTVRNYGKCGANIAADDVRHDSYVERMTSMVPDTDVFVLQGAGNDFGHDIPLGTPGERNERTYCGAIAVIVDYVRKTSPGARIIAVSGMRRHHYDRPRADGLTRDAMHEAFMGTCRLLGIEPHDFTADPLLDPYNPEMMPDGVHMSEKGCRHYAEVIASLITG